MKSKIIPGKIRPISFLFVIPIILIGLLIGQISFNLLVDYRLHQLETQMSPVEATEQPYSEENTEVDQSIDEQQKVAEIVYFKSEAERELIERVVMAEAQGEPFEGMLAVALTIKDRSDLWQLDPVEVVSSPNQFAKPYAGEVSDQVKFAVCMVFDEGYRIIEEPTTHFHADYVNPYWAETKSSRGQIGSHLFFY